MRHLALAAAALTAGCIDDPEAFVADESAPIIGGVPDEGSPAIVMTLTSTGQCTGTLVAPRVVLTAGHCVINSILDDNHGGRVLFGPGGGAGFTDEVRIARLAAHRFYQTFQFYDIAMIRLRDDAPVEVEPMRFQLEPLPDDMLGQYVRVVGYGVTDGETQTGGGVKRTVDLQITSIGPHHIGYGDSTRNICQGDSGGPTLMDDFPNGEVAIAVSSYGADNCRAESKVARTDAYADWLIEVYDAWSGPCRHDGVCVEDDSCRTPDPDCDPCGFDGYCATECPRPDLDCPLGGFVADECEDDFDCEGRRCVTAHDDPRMQYCSQTCDPDMPVLDQCQAPLGACRDVNNDEFVCQYADATPGSQGTDCINGSECRSGVCDPDHDICIEQCGDGLPECGEGFECVSFGDASACTYPPDGGCGCRAGRRGSGGAGGFALAAAVAMLWFIRRRRRGGAA